MRIYRSAIAICAIGALMLFAATSASAKELKVDNDLAQCPNATFVTIQSAVMAANPGDKIQVCAGTYPEQVNIVGKDKLKLEARGNDNPTIQAIPAPPSPTENAIVHINSSDDVTVKGFTITGPFTEPTCGPGEFDRHYGVFVDNSQKAKIIQNHITEIRNSTAALLGCQDGVAVQIGRDAVESVASAKLDHNLIDRYQKGGVVVDGDGSTGDIDHNEVVGDAEAGAITAQNGIQVSRGAGGDVDHNEVRDNIYTGPDQANANATGVLLFETDAPLKIDHNTVHNNDDNISLYDVQGAKVDHNESFDAVRFDGLFADQDSADNKFEDNVAYNNREHDCHDDSAGDGTAGTANIWKGNKGNTQNRPGLCKNAEVTEPVFEP